MADPNALDALSDALVTNLEQAGYSIIRSDDLKRAFAEIERQRLLIAKVNEYADHIWRSANSAYRKAGRHLLEMIAIWREEEK